MRGAKDRLPVRWRGMATVLSAWAVLILTACSAAPADPWCPVSLPATSAGVVSDIAALRDQTLVVALYEPGGLFRSDDGGATWAHLGEGLSGLTPLAVAKAEGEDRLWVGTADGLYRIDAEGTVPVPGAGGVVYELAVTGRDVWAATEMGGFRCSPPGCEAMIRREPMTAVAADGPALCVAIVNGGTWCRPGDEDWQSLGGELPAVVNHLALVDGALLATGGGGLYHCERAGSCRAVPLPAGISARVVAGRGATWWVGTSEHGVIRSRDGGRTWSLPRSNGPHAEVSALEAGANQALWAGTVGDGLAWSRDGGDSWMALDSSPGRRPVFSLLRGEDAQVYVGTAHGVYRAAEPEGPYRPLGGTADPGAAFALGWSDTVLAGSARGVYRWDAAGEQWALTTEGLGRQAIFSLAVDRAEPAVIYAGCWGNNILLSEDAGGTWAPLHGGLETLSGHSFAISPQDPGRLYAGTVEDLYCSTDRGRSWRACGPGRETVFAVFPSPEHPGALFLGSTTGIWRGDEAGEPWERLPTPATATVYTLIGASGGTHVLLAGTDGHGVWRSGDGGRSWQPWGLPGRSVYALLEVGSGCVLAGTDNGLFWAPL